MSGWFELELVADLEWNTHTIITIQSSKTVGKLCLHYPRLKHSRAGFKKLTGFFVSLRMTALSRDPYGYWLADHLVIFNHFLKIAR